MPEPDVRPLPAGFGQRLRAAMAARGPLCVGIDPHPSLLSAWGLNDDAGGLESFSLTVLDAVGEQAAALKPSTEPNEALLQSILRAPAKLVRTTIAAALGARPAQTPSEAAGERSAASKRVVALQRALAEYGYGQIKPSGIVDAETQTAIEKFERERKLPITGQASDRLVRELAAMTGRPLE
jgi:hypothetical protein